ncbi:MAG: sugar phosphate isomerase/epimerase [Clostridia bacterium]|nr:sugar phosphate isomerase/epimerase [Clostridia bacterium]
MEFGLNLFSLRTFIGDEKSFLETAIKLSDMGYSFLQYSGGPYDPDMIARVSKESGMPIVLTHVPRDRIINEADKLMEEHSKFGCKNIGLGDLGYDLIPDKAVFCDIVEKLEAAAEHMDKNGYKFFYHHHHYEFFRREGMTMLEYMMKNAPHINFTLDTYWVQYGGASISETVNKLCGRIDCVHLKDYEISMKNEPKLFFEPSFAPVGDGNINFKIIIPQMKEAGTKYFIVEQDNASILPAPFEQVERSIKYLKGGF